MVTLTRNTSNVEKLDSLSNRKICDVEEFYITTVFGPVKIWKGSTEEEYFNLLFSNGMLTLCMNEREMFLGTEATGVGMVPELRQAVDVSKTDEAAGLTLTQVYTGNGKLEEDIKNITLDDCLQVLGWKLKPDAKIFFDKFLD